MGAQKCTYRFVQAYVNQPLMSLATSKRKVRSSKTNLMQLYFYKEVTFYLLKVLEVILLKKYHF